MREIEKALKSGKWSNYVANLIKENNRAIISIRLHEYLDQQEMKSATYSDIQKNLKIPQSTLTEILKDNIEEKNIVKRYNPDTKQFEYYIVSHFPNSSNPVGQIKIAIWSQVYDNPKLTPSQKTDMALDYIVDLLHRYGQLQQLKQINKLLKGIEPKTDFHLQSIENAIKINFEFAKKFNFADELYKRLTEVIIPSDPKQTLQLINDTKDKFKKYKISIKT